ncbi:hypothetical protein PTTG_01692, partial [Puccinia triticina 1-1 BBBD Race 1]
MRTLYWILDKAKGLPTDAPNKPLAAFVPLVECFLMNAKREFIVVKRAEFKVENMDGEVQSHCSQLPLILAGAMSIHKSRGKTTGESCVLGAGQAGRADLHKEDRGSYTSSLLTSDAAFSVDKAMGEVATVNLRSAKTATPGVVQTPRNCSTCPRNICISSAASSPATHPGSAGLAAPIGGAIGRLAAGLLIILSLWILYKRNMLPSCFTAIFESRSTKSFSKKHPHRLRNNNQKKNRFLQSNSHNLKSQNKLPHQSVIYLPTDTRDPKTASIIESDDDPFSDKHSG